jgi:hypothetical protein
MHEVGLAAVFLPAAFMECFNLTFKLTFRGRRECSSNTDIAPR